MKRKGQMSIDKDKLIKLIDDNLDIVYTDEDMDGLIKVVNEIIKLFTPSTIKEKLYQAVIKRELKEKYEEGRYGTNCIACGKIAFIKDGILIQEHYRRCSTGQLERISNL